MSDSSVEFIGQGRKKASKFQIELEFFESTRHRRARPQR
jgi:hypothetical protein